MEKELEKKMNRLIKQIKEKPGIIGIVANKNQGKSNLIYALIQELRKTDEFNLYTFGLRNKIENSQEVHSVEQLEEIKNGFIIIDEFCSLFDLDNRKEKKLIEDTLRRIHHGPNTIILVGLGDNFKKFISDQLDIIIYKKINLGGMINGSTVKKRLQSYQGSDKGSTILNLELDEALVFDGKNYYKIHVDYVEAQDTKKDNAPIFTPKKK